MYPEPEFISRRLLISNWTSASFPQIKPRSRELGSQKGLIWVHWHSILNTGFCNSCLARRISFDWQNGRCIGVFIRSALHPRGSVRCTDFRPRGTNQSIYPGLCLSSLSRWPRCEDQRTTWSNPHGEGWHRYRRWTISWCAIKQPLSLQAVARKRRWQFFW